MQITRASITLARAIAANRSLRRQLVGACDVSEQTVRNWESGGCSPKEKYRPTIREVAGIPENDWEEPIKNGEAA